MHADPEVKQSAKERRLEELVRRRRQLRATEVTWRNRVAVERELAEIATAIDFLLDGYGKR